MQNWSNYPLYSMHLHVSTKWIRSTGNDSLYVFLPKIDVLIVIIQRRQTQLCSLTLTRLRADARLLHWRGVPVVRTIQVIILRNSHLAPGRECFV